MSSYTPLEQNGIDLGDILTAINNLPEYQENPPDVKLDFFSLYDAFKIVEWVETVNLASDTSFDPTEYTDSQAATTIRAATSASEEKSVTVDANNFLYVSTLEWFFVPAYTEQKPADTYMVGKARIEVNVLSSRGYSMIADCNIQKYVNWQAVPVENTNNYGIYFGSAGFGTFSSGKISFTLPTIVARPGGNLASADSLRAIDAENTDMHFRTRLYRLPYNQFLNVMTALCRDMIQDEAFAEEEETSNAES